MRLGFKRGRGRIGEGGSVMVEAALIMPVFLLLIFGILEGARLGFDYNLLTHAVREGTRLAAVTPSLQIDDAAVLNRVDEILQTGGLQATQRSLTFTPPLQGSRTIHLNAAADFVPIVVMLWPKNSQLRIPLHVEMVTRYEL